MDLRLAEQITVQERFFGVVIAHPEGVTFRTEEFTGVPVETTTPEGGVTDPDLLVLYLHGGGYSSGCAKWARRATARLALGTGGRVIAPDYRLAPRFPFPAAHEDVLTVYQHVIEDLGFAPQCVGVAGDSAGGALAVSLLADCRDRGIPMPGCGMVNSLWADIALNTPSLDDPVRNGHDIPRALVDQLSAILLSTGNVDPYDPRHSPVYRDLTSLPPLLIQAAGRDVCHDDSVRLAANARRAGVAVTITEYPDVDHIWILNGPCRMRFGPRFPNDIVEFYISGEGEPPEATTAIDEMCSFMRKHCVHESARGGRQNATRPCA